MLGREKSLKTIVFHSHTFRKSFEQPLKLFFQTNCTERKKRCTLLDTVFFFLVSFRNVKKLAKRKSVQSQYFCAEMRMKYPKEDGIKIMLRTVSFFIFQRNRRKTTTENVLMFSVLLFKCWL